MTNQLEQVTSTTIQTPDLIPVSEWNKYYPYPSVGALRQLIHKVHLKHDLVKFKTDKGAKLDIETNDFEKVVRRLGKRLYIKVSAFNEWVENGQVA